MHGLVQSFDAYIGVIWQVSRAAFPNNVDAAMALTSIIGALPVAIAVSMVTVAFLWAAGVVWKQALAFRTDGSVPPGAAGGGPTARTATRASVDAAAERTVERLQAVVEGSRERGASAAAGSATRPGSAFFQRWVRCSAAVSLRQHCSAAPVCCLSLADLAVVLVAKLRPGGEAAAMLRAKPAEQRAGGLAARLGGASPAEALRLLGVVRIVSQTDSVELVDDADAADLRSGDTLTVHWASPGELPAAERAGGRHEGASGGVEAAASAGPPAGVDGLRRRAKQSHA
ncbi:hypothetical protein FNF28_01470 [Cafeteria roenbergensis]|uniref:Uncharacterized protein n=1 Tax=Cafeteria roenbergensis TaxID=33653 RepID=A0A5A8DYD5_CAFRO|nr:hypothetical protein FNF28_01470 [Cafeteria roenbergensis]